jgi:serine/threonine protein kinase
MTKTQTCAGCEASLSEGVPDVFCPVCALRQALAIGNPVPGRPSEAEIIPRTGFATRNMEDRQNPQIFLASTRNRERQSAMMTQIAPVPGEVIEDYEILEKVGGNMGFVFKARHLLLDKVVALKLLPADWISDPARLARFQREMRVMGQLAHPNLVTAADARSVDSWHLVAMEWIEGLDLQRLVRTQGPLPVAVACEVIRQAALALQYAHEHGLIHRDIKPSNLMLTRAGTIKVIDLGLALTREETTPPLTHPGVVLGTMTYCAPEQFRDASAVDIRADLYSLGCTLYHLLTGQAPYGDRKTLVELVQAHLNDPFPSLGEARPDAPASLQAVLARMTAKDPAARFATPGEVAEALEPFAQGANLKTLFLRRTQQTSPPRITAAQAAPSSEGPGRAAERQQRPKARWPHVAALLVLLLAITAAGFLMMSPAAGDPVVILMDTTAPGGVYDEENRIRGGTNAEELNKLLHDLLPNSLRQEAISSTWEREAQVLAMHPRLVVIHRSLFFHSLNAELKFGSPPFADPADYERWRTLYRIGDDRVRAFIGLVGTVEPHTEFLVYSRGTDENWLDLGFRERWKKELEDRFPKLKHRVITMLIPGLKAGTFRDHETGEKMRDRIKAILGLHEKAD